MSRLRVAIIGCGKIADQHVSAIQRIPETRIVGVCDREKLMADQLAERFKIEGSFGDVDQLLNETRTDVVHVTTPPQSHFELAKTCMAAGCHVYVEKPFANIMSDARAALKLVTGSKQIVQVGTQRRSTPSYMKAYDFLKSGKFGDIVMAEMTWNVNQPGRWRRLKAVPELREQDTDWKRYLINRPFEAFDARKYLEFRLFWPYSSGIPDQWMVHQIDTVHWFTGFDHPTSVVANGGIYLWRDGRKNFDTMTAVFDYGNAAKGGKGFQVVYSSRQTNSAGGVKEIYYSNGGSMNLDTRKITSDGGLEQRYAKDMGKEPFLLS